MKKIAIFQKYNSLINHYMEQVIHDAFMYNPRLKKDKYIVYEKLDGSNVSFAITKDSVSYCSREKTISNDPTKVGFHGLGGILENYQGIINEIQKILKKSNETQLITLYGEFFGRGIQKRIDYGDEKRVLFYDVAIDGVIQPQFMFLELMKFHGYEDLICPIEGIYDTFEEAMAVANDMPSNLSPTEWIREGNVIKPYTEYPTMGNDKVFMVKNKNTKFSEKKPKTPLTEEEIALMKEKEVINAKFVEYINSNRLDSVLSKEDIEVSKKTMGKLIPKLLNDAREDFLLENEEYANMPNIEKILAKLGGKTCAEVILQRIG